MYTDSMQWEMDKKKYIQLYGEIFEEVQRGHIFPDSKTFVDSVPLFPTEEILKKYQLAKLNPNFNLKQFIIDNFDLPSADINILEEITEHKNYRDALFSIWNILTRDGHADPVSGSTLIPLSKKYIVPGGRFREVFYWDSFFTALGLLYSNKVELIESICDNFAELINEIGHIPNSSRVYCVNRSQPPVFILMVDLLARRVDARYIKKYIEVCEKEYRYWMDGYHLFDGNLKEHNRVVDLDVNEILNRYYDQEDLPREEAFYEDTTLAQKISTQQKSCLYRNIRAAAESGWDFSSRWLSDPNSPESSITTDIVPVDLNSFLFMYEKLLSEWHDRLGKAEIARMYSKLAEKRKSLVQKYCYDRERQFFCDYSWKERAHTPVLSLAGVFPLFAKIATKEQAELIAHHIEEDFLCSGGVVTTLIETGEQWDFPNGWAPLQWITIQGLKNYGFMLLANEIKSRWVDNCIRIYNETGCFFEKYNVVTTKYVPVDGEYPTQVGFGWTNGVLLDLLSE